MSCGCTHTPSCNPCCTCPPAPAVNLPICTGGEPCEEISKVDCVSFTGPNLPALGILNNDRLLTVLLRLHKAINPLLGAPIATGNYTATNTATTAPIPSLVVTYLGLGPVYTSTAGATSASTVITVGSTTGLVAGMTLEVTAGVGAFAPGTTVASISGPTSFIASQAPSTALSGGATVIRATGSDHQIFTINVVAGTPQTFKAFIGSPVKVSGTGTIV